MTKITDQRRGFCYGSYLERQNAKIEIVMFSARSDALLLSTSRRKHHESTE